MQYNNSNENTQYFSNNSHSDSLTLPWTPEVRQRREEARSHQREQGDARRSAAAERLARLHHAREEDTSAAVAAELNLVLRGKPYEDSVLRYATGELANLRDALVAVDAGRERYEASLAWLDEAREERWPAYQLVMDARDSEREATRLLAKARRSQERAADFFQQDAQLALNGDAGAPLPDVPRHSPATFLTTLTKRHRAGQTTEWTSLCPMTKDWKTDAAAYQKRVQRLVNRIREEQNAGATFYTTIMDEDEWETTRARWDKRAQRGGEEVRWARLPQEDKRVVVFHTSEEDASDAPPLPSDNGELTAVVFPLMRTPEGQKATASGGFGGCYQGARGDGRSHQAKREGAVVEVVGQFVTSGAGGLVRAARVLDVELSKTMRGRRELEHEDAVVALLSAGFQLLPRHVHQAGLAALLDAFVLAQEVEEPPEAGEMSNISHIEEEDAIVTYIGQADWLVDYLPPPDRLEPAPIYLEGGETWR